MSGKSSKRMGQHGDDIQPQQKAPRLLLSGDTHLSGEMLPPEGAVDTATLSAVDGADAMAVASPFDAEPGQDADTSRFPRESCYDPPFTLLEQNRLVQDQKKISREITSEYKFLSNKRLRKQVTVNDFDWCLPTIKAADEALKTYDTNYYFTDGFHMLDRNVSNIENHVPKSVKIRLSEFVPHLKVTNHPLCNIEQKPKRMFQQVENFIEQINALIKKPVTRLSEHKALMGQDLFFHAVYVNATEFFFSRDDVGLIDFVEESAKKIWYCSDVFKSIMLRKAVTAVYTKSMNGEQKSLIPEWLSYLDPEKGKAKPTAPQLQFLGLVSLYQTKTESKVVAFILHSFVIYSDNPKSRHTRLHLMITESRLRCTSVVEKLLQILQIMQFFRTRTPSLKIVGHCASEPDIEAYKNLGFTINDKRVLVKDSVAKLLKFTNRSLWACYGNYLSISAQKNRSTATVDKFGIFLYSTQCHCSFFTCHTKHKQQTHSRFAIIFHFDLLAYHHHEDRRVEACAKKEPATTSWQQLEDR